MKGFIAISASLSALLVAAAAVAQEVGRFIPQSPLNESERASERVKLKKIPSFTDQFIDELLADEERYHTYREADILATYPELRGEKKLWSCSNHIMSGATEIAFLAGRGKANEVTLDKLRCRRVKNGLSCDEPQRDRYYFLDSTERYFSLDGLTFETARTILETHAARPVSGAPQWLDSRNMQISSIKSLSGNRYQMIFGDALCSGCFAKFDVRLESRNGENELVFAGDANAGCF